MSENDGEKHVFSYMDGIPVKISEKYKPPRKVVLPVGFQNRLLQPPVCPDYDFQLEREVLEKLHLWQSLRAKEKEKQQQRLETNDAEHKKLKETMQELEKTMNELSNIEETTFKNTSPPSLSPIQDSSKAQAILPPQAAVNAEENPILRPIPIKHQVMPPQISSNYNNNVKPTSAFNLSDFEADTSSPFDNMELKTLNDLEELAQVLQPSNVSKVSGYYQSALPSGELFSNVTYHAGNSQVCSTENPYNLPSSNKMFNDLKCANFQPHMNGFATNFDYNSIHGYHPQSVIPNSNSQQAAYSFHERNILSQPSDVSFTYAHQETLLQPQDYYRSGAWAPVPYHQARHEPTCYSILGEGKTNLASSSNAVPCPVISTVERSEKSLVEDVEPSINHVAQQLSNLMKSRAAERQSKPSVGSTPETSSSIESPTSPTEVDPLGSLDAGCRLLVSKIVEMGFPRARVARACQKFGCSDKKVVEFLLSLQLLLDAGYQEGPAEHALSLLNQDVNAAIKFLQVESQLLDLGFSADRISEALVKFNCDRDQALEFLISS